MFKDRAERRAYRKSPGRQYDSEYNPLRGQGRGDISTQDETWDDDTAGRRPSRPSGGLSHRPDPRRTRQLMRRSILASKTQATTLEDVQEYDETEEHEERNRFVRPIARQPFSSRRTSVPQRSPEFEGERIVEDWGEDNEDEPVEVDPDLGYDEEIEDDPLDERLPRLPLRASGSARRTRVLDEDEDELLEAELEAKRRRASRRKFLLGTAVVGGAAVAAYEILPRLPDAIGSGAASLEHQLQQAFENGVTSGANTARKELLNGLDTLEGFSLEGAMEAARLTRVAYDVFVSPLVTLAATVADDFLAVTLNALITGRHWLAQINEDSPTLAALQTVLQTWVDQVHEMPRKVQSITDTDLDGALSYLRALQRKIQEEQAQLNSQPKPTPPARPQQTPAPKH
jgi:hypothetical protein